MRCVGLAIVWTLLSVSGAAAQPPHPDCAKLPGGGKIKVEVPGIVGPPTCQACAPGFQIPANFVLGFSDNSRATCELKRPDGTNSGMCRANSQCPAGTQRVMQNGAWACQAPATYMEVSCPAVRRPPDPPRVGGGRVPPPPCLEQLKAAERELKEREAALRQTIGNDASTRGSALGTSAGKRVEATVMLVAAIAHLYAEPMPTGMVMLAACDNVDKSNATAVADCNRATANYNRSVERFYGLYTRYENADRAARREWEAATRTSTPGAAVGSAIDQITRDADEAAKQAQACLAEIKRRAFPQPF
jgi:hypothetical protein